jgi:Flp pilus assembly protein TadG
MFRDNQLVHNLRRVGARVLARAGVDRSKLAVTESEAAGKLAIRIGVCLEAYHKPLEVTSALAAGVRSSPKSDETLAPQPVALNFSWLRRTQAAALIEFAVALPLLVVLVVGIFDFGGAFNLKQELNNAVREGARFGAAQPTNDLGLGQPPSVDAVRYLVDSYLRTAGINDCGLSSATWAFAGGNLTWHFSATNGCSMTLDVSRGVPVPTSFVVGQPAVNVMATTVSISYPYQWHFNSVIQLLVPGANYTFANLTSDATAVNMD